MAIEFLLPMLASILQGGIGQAIQAGTTARMNNEQIRLARLRREELQPIIDQLRTTRDYTQMDEQLVRDFSRASDQMAAQAAQSGMTNAGSGGLDQVRRDVLGAMIANLAQVKAQDDAQRQQLLAEILSDPSLYAGEHAQFNPGMDALLGGLGGALAGAGSTLTAFLSTPEGIDILKGLGASQAAPQGTLGVNAGIYATPIGGPTGKIGISEIAGITDRAAAPPPRFTNPYGRGGGMSIQQIQP